MPDLLAIGCNALQMQERYERLEPRIGRCRAGFSAHKRSPGPDVTSSVWLRQQRLLGRWLIGNRRRTLTIARVDEARSHELAQQSGRPSAVARRRTHRGLDDHAVAGSLIKNVHT